MIRPATHRVTIDGLEMDLDDNGEIVRVWSEPAPSCEPTYALSHRFGWPDASGVMRCACGAWSDSPAARPCRIHAPAISDLREPFEQSMNIAEYVVIVQAEHMAPDDPDDEERQRCERLGVEWVGPDVQAGGPDVSTREGMFEVSWPHHRVAEEQRAYGDERE